MMGSNVEGEPKAAIMQATYQALCKHGYADLTMQDIADESSLSKAALHYHYDSKQRLFEAFHTYLSERFFSRISGAEERADSPPDRLAAILNAVLSPPTDDDFADIQRALLELKAQGSHDSAIRSRLETFDTELRTLLSEVIADGVESGHFHPQSNPEDTARFIATVLAGAQTRQVSVGQSLTETRSLIRTQVEDVILVSEDCK